MKIVDKDKNCFSLLSNLLTHQISFVEQASDYLNQIKLSIEKNDVETLQTLIKNNNIPLNQIEEHEKARFNLINNYGFEKTKEGFLACVKSFDDSEQSLIELHSKLLKALDMLQVSTKVSDLLVTKNMQRVKQSLSILTGTSLAKDPTYSASGYTHKDSLTRDLATA